MLLGALGALLAGVAVAGAPAAPAVAPTFTLVASPTCGSGHTRMGRGCVDRPTQTNWTITDGSVKWDQPGQWLGTYTWTIPQTVPAAGAPVKMQLTAEERTGRPNNRICPAIGAVSGFTFKGGLSQPAILGFCAEAVVNPTVSGTKTVTLVPSPAAAPGSLVYLSVGVQDGPTFTYTYKGGAAATGCTRSSASTAAAPAASGTVTFNFSQAGVPRRGESPTLVKSTAGGRGSFSICGDPFKKVVTGTKAKGTIVHVDEHAHLGRVVTDRLVLTIVGARLRVFGGAVGHISGELFVKVTASSDSLCKVGRLGSIELLQAVVGGGGDSQLTMSLCGRAHDHEFLNGAAGRRGVVRVAISFVLPR